MRKLIFLTLFFAVGQMASAHDGLCAGCKGFTLQDQIDGSMDHASTVLVGSFEIVKSGNDCVDEARSLHHIDLRFTVSETLKGTVDSTTIPMKIYAYGSGFDGEPISDSNRLQELARSNLDVEKMLLDKGHKFQKDFSIKILRNRQDIIEVGTRSKSPFVLTSIVSPLGNGLEDILRSTDVLILPNETYAIFLFDEISSQEPIELMPMNFDIHPASTYFEVQAAR